MFPLSYTLVLYLCYRAEIISLHGAEGGASEVNLGVKAT